MLCNKLLKDFLGGTDTHLLNLCDLKKISPLSAAIFYFWFWRETGFEHSADVYSQEIISVYYWPNIKAECIAYAKVLNS